MVFILLAPCLPVLLRAFLLMKKYLILLLLFPVLAYGVSLDEVHKIVDDRISAFVSIQSGLLLVALGWLFKLFLSNKQSINQIDSYRREEHNKFLIELEKERDKRQALKDHIEQQMMSNCASVNDKIEAHKLHVANNYVRDVKISAMIEDKIKPLEDKLDMLQQTINLLVVELKKGH